jgi:ribosomal protein S18 acetylase RimI-like enzyme
MTIRNADLRDLEKIYALESICFPIEEAATKESLKKRLTVYPQCFWLSEDDGKIIGMINGMTTNEKFLSDEMYSDTDLYSENGDWLVIFGVDTLPDYRNSGIASGLMHHVIDVAKVQNRKGIILTCKQHLIHFYEKFGFQNEGIASSEHGSAVWYHMRANF